VRAGRVTGPEDSPWPPRRQRGGSVDLAVLAVADESSHTDGFCYSGNLPGRFGWIRFDVADNFIQKGYPPSVSVDLKRCSVLIIDDSEIARMALAELFQSAGCTVHQRENPIGASAEIIKHGVHVVVVDMQMPLMSGTRFVELVRKNPRLDPVKLVLITGASQDELESAGKEAGADAVVSKRSLTSDLLPTVQRLLSDDASRAGRRLLLIADDGNHAASFMDRLRSAGYQTTLRDRGRGALVAVVELKPEVILVQTQLEDIPTESVVSLLLENRRSSHIPILLTGEGTQAELDARARELGARGAIAFGSDEQTLRGTLRGLAAPG